MTPNRRLKQARELRGWSQAKVAEQIGTDATTVSRWERGVFSPTPYFRERLCKLFSKNAEELGLLETADQPQERMRNDFSLQPPMTIPSFQTNEEWQREDLHTKNTVSLMPPSWPKRTDTFSYILHSVAHDQQAHMLWGDAYVQALRGHRAEAQQLGEASLNAFERVGHLNAAAIREWLNQRELDSPPSPPASVSPMPPMPLPMHPDQHKRPARRIVRGRGTGIALILMFVVTLALAGFAFSQFSTALVLPQEAHALSSAKNATSTPVPSSTSTPAPSPTSTPVPSPTPTPAPSPALTVEVMPTSLTPPDCPHESLGYRCTLTLWLSTNGQRTVPWYASSTNVPAQFNPSRGNCTSGQQVQVIVYIQSSPGQKSQLIFTFTFASKLYTTSATWAG